MARAMRYDKRGPVRGEQHPFARGRSDRATRPQLARVRQLAAEEGIGEPVPAGEYLTRREAGRYIDRVLIERAKGGRNG